MSSSSRKNDDGVPPLYRQGGSLSKIGYFKAAHIKISSDNLFRDFLETYWHAIPSGVRVRRVKDGSSREPCSGTRRTIKFHPYYFVLGFTFPIPRFFQEVLCSMKCAPAQCSPNAVRVMVGFHNLNQFFDLGLTTNEFWYFFDIGRIDGVGQLRIRHKLFDNSSKGDHDWAKETLEISGEWESDSSPELRVSTVFISDSEFGSTPRVSPDMKKVHVALGIPSEYREWRWLLSPLRREKGGLPPEEEIKRIKADAMARPITVVEPTTNEGGKKKHSPPAQEIPAEKKMKTARGDSPAAPKIVIDLTSSKGEKERTATFVPVTPIASKAASSIAEKIAQRKSSSVPLVPKFVPKRPSGTKPDLPLKRLATMKSDKVPLSAKVAPNTASSAAATISSADKNEAARSGRLEESAKAVSEEAAKICALLKPDLLEDMDVCAQFVDGVKEIVGPSLFAKHTPEYRKTALLAMMQKTTILAAESMFLDQEDTKAAKEMARTMAAEAYSSVEKIKKLESELAALKESHTSDPTSQQLEAAHQEIMDLKTRFDAIRDLERSISELRSAAYAKDEELIATYNQAIHFKEVADRLEPQVSELQGVLKTNDNLKKEIEELQRVRACLFEENEQLKSEKNGFEASLIQNQSDFYKLGYVDHLYGRPSDFEFSAGGVDTQAGTVEGKGPEDAAAENTKAAEGVTTEQLGDVQTTEE
ncbi:uncharacterized protein LOC126615257 [Malus sylvestris]|uniref:uncharacterized protein LOC126615257 n=1 Tax=Malus sylvestris TaxID=3752 RepID=UPI0021ABD581|nr:uncharacterized protein LOC126615257 [Malus sylvestris]